MKYLTFEKMCPQVFILDGYELRILKFLAIHGPLNLNQISQFTTKYVDSLDRWAVKKRLHGSSTFMGLIPYEYVIERKTKKHRFGKDEKKYYLTTKGIIAISSIVPLQKNFFFKKYSGFYGEIITVPNTQSFFESYVEENMKLIVAMHFLNGIQLTRQQSSSSYYSGIFYRLNSLGNLDIIFNNWEIQNEFGQIFQECMINNSIIDIVTNGRLFLEGNSMSLVDWKRTNSVRGSEHRRWGNVWNWPYELNDNRFVEDHRTATDTQDRKLPIFTGSNFYNKETKKKIDARLKNSDYKTVWKSKPADFYAD